MSKKLRDLGAAWEDFGAEFHSMADKVDQFVADLFGQSASTDEVKVLKVFFKVGTINKLFIREQVFFLISFC